MLKKLLKILMGIAGTWLLLAIGMLAVLYYFSTHSIDSQNAADSQHASDAVVK